MFSFCLFQVVYFLVFRICDYFIQLAFLLHQLCHDFDLNIELFAIVLHVCSCFLLVLKFNQIRLTLITVLLKF
jgi:hypothetical protein